MGDQELHEKVKELLDYDPETGVFVWRIARSKKKAGMHAGAVNKEGYERIRIDRKYYLSHRLAWFYTNGLWPLSTIDHINTIRSDNRIANLRVATHAQNLQNRSGPTSASSTKLLGVSWHKASKKWIAQICLDQKKIYLGTYETQKEASEAYWSAKSLMHPFSIRR